MTNVLNAEEAQETVNQMAGVATNLTTAIEVARNFTQDLAVESQAAFEEQYLKILTDLKTHMSEAGNLIQDLRGHVAKYAEEFDAAQSAIF